VLLRRWEQREHSLGYHGCSGFNMLRFLGVRHLAVIDHLEVEFNPA
jgi:hypothetical protein